jgi:hypothetical protein
MAAQDAQELHTVGGNEDEWFDAQSTMPDYLSDAMSSLPVGDLNHPHVLISIALENDQMLDSRACSEWLARFPALAKYAKIQGVYKSYSTLILASVPVTIWNLLPEDLSCSFVGFVTSCNLIYNHDSISEPEETKQLTISGRTEERVQPQGRHNTAMSTRKPSHNTNQSNISEYVSSWHSTKRPPQKDNHMIRWPNKDARPESFELRDLSLLDIECQTSPPPKHRLSVLAKIFTSVCISKSSSERRGRLIQVRAI